jgi:hypothetical protein
MASPDAHKTRLVRNWPITSVGLLLISCGPVSWVEASLRLGLVSFGSYLRRVPFLNHHLAHFSHPLPMSPAFLAAAGTAVFSLGLLFVSLAKHQAVVQPPRKRGEEEEDRPPMQLGVPEWLRAEGKPALEITATPKPAADPASLGTYFPS